MSEACIERSSKALEELETRSLEDLDFAALIRNAKHGAGEQMTVAFGVTLGGRKIPLDFAEGSTEYRESVKRLLCTLMARGLRFEEEILFIRDGASRRPVSSRT